MAEAAAEGFRVVAETTANYAVTSKGRERHRHLFPKYSFQKISHMHLEGSYSLCLAGLTGAQVGPLLYGHLLTVAFGVVEPRRSRLTPTPTRRTELDIPRKSLPRGGNVDRRKISAVTFHCACSLNYEAGASMQLACSPISFGSISTVVTCPTCRLSRSVTERDHLV